MNEREFHELLHELDELSGNGLEAKLRTYSEPPVISLLCGAEFDDIGLGKKTVHSVAERVYDSFDPSPTVTQALDELSDSTEDGHDIEQLYLDVVYLDSLSGNEQKDYLEDMFEDYSNAAVVSYAVLNDWSLGFTENSVARAHGVKDSLPFYENVVDIFRDDEPRTQPTVGEPFRPMLAKSESHLPDDLDEHYCQIKMDGYRVLLSISEDSKKAFTRRMNDVTESLPELEEIDWPDGDYILDAEVIAETGSYNDTSKRIGRSAENVERDVDMEFALFDIIIDEGEHVHEEPYTERHARLLKFCGRAHGAGVPAQEFPQDNAFVLESYHNLDRDEAREIGRDYEGLIWKDPDAPYEFDKRSSAWVKEKNEEESIDVLVTRFEEGQGRLDGSLGKVYVESSDGELLGAVGTGFTDDERDEIWQNRDEWEGKTIEVTAEAMDSNGLLRFPRFERVRSDTDAEPDKLSRIQSILSET